MDQSLIAKIRLTVRLVSAVAEAVVAFLDDLYPVTESD